MKNFYYWLMYQYRTTHNIWNIWGIQFGYTSCKFLSMLQHTKQVLGHNAWWNQHTWNIRRSIHNMPKSQLTVLHTKHTTSTTCQPTNLCISSVCQGLGQYPEKMFHTDQESQQCKLTNIHSSTCLDNNLTIHSSTFMLICPGEAPRLVKPQTPIHVLWLQPACSATSQHFHLPPWYKSHEITINISLNSVKLNVVTISVPELRIWQHLEDHWNGTLLRHLANIPSIAIEKLYKHMVSSKEPISPYLSTDESIGEIVSVWTPFSHAGVYVMALGSLIPAGLGIFCCYFFWCQPVRLACWPLQSGSMQYTIVDDNVDAAPIYWWDSKAGHPIVRLHKIHDLHMEWEPTWTERQQKQQIQPRAVPASGSLDATKIQGMW